ERQHAAAATREILRAAEKERWALLRQVASERDEAASLRETTDLIRERLKDTDFEKRPRTIAWLRWADRRIEELDILARSPEVIFARLIARNRPHACPTMGDLEEEV